MALDSELGRLGEQMAGRRTGGAQVTTTAAVSQSSGLTGTDAMIEVEGASKAFGSVLALVDLVLAVTGLDGRDPPRLRPPVRPPIPARRL